MFSLISKYLKKLVGCLDYSFVIIDKSRKILFNNKAFKERGYSFSSIIPNDIDLGNLGGKIDKEIEVECDRRVDQVAIKIIPFEISASKENRNIGESFPKSD